MSVAERLWRRLADRSAVAAAGALTAAAVVGCAASPAAPQTDPPNPVLTTKPGPAPAAAAPVQLAPLTGLPVHGSGAGNAVVAVPMTTGKGLAPPTGLAAADVVFESYLGHDTTRLLALFQSHDPATAGPVAGTLPSDGQLLSVLHPVLANTGGSSGFVKTLDATTVIDASPARVVHGYTSAKTATAVPGVLRKTAGTDALPPPGIFLYRDDKALPANHSTRASSVVVTIPGQQPEHWSYSGAAGRWKRSDANAPDISVANVVLQQVPYDAVLVHHPGTATVPVARPLGTGRATILSGRTATAASWDKPGVVSVTNYLDAANIPIWLQPGATWVCLLPPQARVTVT